MHITVLFKVNSVLEPLLTAFTDMQNIPIEL